MNVLGLVSDTHDTGVALVRDGRILGVLEEERFNRTKRTKAFPRLALQALMNDAGLAPRDIAAVALPWNERVLRRRVARAIVSGLPASVDLMHARAHPAQRNKILVLGRTVHNTLRRLWGPAQVPPIVSVGHHDAHAAAYFVSPFERALVLVMDGYGDDAATSAYLGDGDTLRRVWKTDIFNSLGLVYTVVTSHLGFEGFGDEGKVMALAAYGTDALVERFRECIRPTADGGYAVDMSFFDYHRHGQIQPFTAKFIDTFGPPRRRDAPLEDRHRDLARALQMVTEEIVVHMVRSLGRLFPVRHLVMTGGVALNCVANARVLADTDITRVWIPPCASDTGAPLGAALWHTHQTLQRPRTMELTHPFYGLAYPQRDVESLLYARGVAFERLDDAALVDRVANDLAGGAVVGWFQGRFEMGPRALGNRSILADPRRAEMRETLNRRIKKREPFRPFAPAVPVERAAEFFEISQPDPFMTLAPRVRPEKRAAIAAAVHIDGTGRIQTVDAAANPRYHALLTAFGRLTGVPVLINTSFNENEPIVASPSEALDCFLRTSMDVLVLGDCYVRRPDVRDRMAGGTTETTMAAT